MKPKFCSAKKRYLIQIETNQRKWRGRRLSPAFARTVRLRHRAVGWHLGCLEVRILSMQCQFCPSLRSIPVPLATQHGVSQHLNEEEKFARAMGGVNGTCDALCGSRSHKHIRVDCYELI